LDGQCLFWNLYEGTCEAPWNLEQRIAIEGGFVNDIQPHDSNDGKYLYYTMTHSSKTRNQLSYVVFDYEMPDGSFHRMDISTNTTNYTTKQLGDGIYFANGLTSSSDGSSIYISETAAARILKYDITSGTIEPFLEHIPILTDNIYVGQNNGELLVPGYTHNNTMETILKDPSTLSDFLK
jgi:hypothetical protein